MGKSYGSTRAMAGRVGLKVSRLPNGGIASGGKYKYAIRGPGGTNMRARTLGEARSLITSTRNDNRRRGEIWSADVDSRGRTNGYSAYSQAKGKGGTVGTLRGTFRTRRAAQQFIDRGFR